MSLHLIYIDTRLIIQKFLLYQKSLHGMRFHMNLVKYFRVALLRKKHVQATAYDGRSSISNIRHINKKIFCLRNLALFLFCIYPQRIHIWVRWLYIRSC